MKKIYLLIIAFMTLLMSGCMMESQEAEGYTEKVVFEGAEPIYALKDARVLEVEMLEERSIATKSLIELDTIVKIEPETLKFDQSKLTQVSVKDTSKILEKNDEELSRKELKFKKDVENQYKQEEINRNLDMLEEQQMKLDSLLKKKKDEI